MGEIIIESSGEKEDLEAFHKDVKEIVEASAKVNDVLVAKFKSKIFKLEDKSSKKKSVGGSQKDANTIP